MVKPRNKPTSKPSIKYEPCVLCEALHTRPSDTCMACTRRLRNMSSDNATQTDKDIISILRESRQERRERLVHNLGRSHNNALQEFKTKYESLQKRFKTSVKRAVRLTQLARTRSRNNQANQGSRNTSNAGLNLDEICNQIEMRQNQNTRSNSIKKMSGKPVQTDKGQLQKLLKKDDIQKQLPSLIRIAMQAKVPHNDHQDYLVNGPHFCDGVMVKLGLIQQYVAQVTSIKLRADMQASMNSLIIQNVLYKDNPGGSYIWISFTPESSRDPTGLWEEIRRLVQAVKEHARYHWNYKGEDIEAIKVAKIDIAQDFFGSFIPMDEDEAYHQMKEILQSEVRYIFNDFDTNFLSNGATGDVKVKKNKNCLKTCFQFDVHDDENRKLTTIKVYDKVLELVSRDFYHLVGSRIATVVGSKTNVNFFNHKIQACQAYGMTRLEMSIHEDALQKYRMNEPSVRTSFYPRVKACMNQLAHEFLNDEYVRGSCYHKIPTNVLLMKLGLSNFNLLAVGKKNCWLVNATTPHQSHYVGTEGCVRVYENPTHVLDWERIKEFVAKYAAVNARIDIYWLHQGRSQLRKTATVWKPVDSSMSLPGCTQTFLNGIRLAKFIKGPVNQEDAKATTLKNWIPAVRNMAKAIDFELKRNKKNASSQGVPIATSE